MSQSITLVEGESFQVNGTTVTIAQCGLKVQGGGRPRPNLTVEFDEPSEEATEDEPEQIESYESLGLSSSVTHKLSAKWSTVAELREAVANGVDISDAVKGIGDTTETEILAALDA